MGDETNVNVNIGGKQVKLEDARKAMNAHIRARIEAQHPNHASAEGAQAFVDAYKAEHDRTEATPFAVDQGGQGHGGDPGHQGQGQGQANAPGQNKPTPR